MVPSWLLDVAARLMLLGAVALAACTPHAPASMPPQLKHNLGAYIVVSSGHVDTGRYRFDYPQSWQLVKQSAANAKQLHLILIAANGSKVSLLDVDSDGAETDRIIPLAAGSFVQVTIDPTDDNDAVFAEQVEQLVDSIRS